MDCRRVLRIFAVTLAVTFLAASCSAMPVGGTGAPSPGTSIAPRQPGENDPVVLSWYDNTVQTHQFDEAHCLVDKVLFEKTGVKIAFSSPPEESYDRLNAMIASNSLPDIVTVSYDMTKPTLKFMMEGGKLYCITDLMASYAPEFQQDLPKSMMEWYRFTDGKLYGIASFYYAAEKMQPGFELYTSAGMVARQDIMYELGIRASDFASKDGFVAALKKVRDAGLKDDNGAAVLPFYLGTDVISDIGWVLGGMFGLAPETPSGDYVDAWHAPGMLEVLKFASRLYREGLIGIGNFTSTNQKIRELALSGSLFSFMGHMSDFRYTATRAYNKNKEWKYIPVDCVRSESGAKPTFSSQNTNGWQFTGIAKSCQKPDRAIHLLQFMYSTEGQALTAFGLEGTTYEAVDGKYAFTSEYVNAMNADADKAKREYGVGVYTYMKDPVFERTMAAPPTDDAAMLYPQTVSFFSKYVYADRCFDGVWPDPGTDEDATYARIVDYQAKFLPGVVMAKTDDEVETLYREMLAHEDELGWPDIQRIANGKFQANKRKLGLRYGWPPNGE